MPRKRESGAAAPQNTPLEPTKAPGGYPGDRGGYNPELSPMVPHGGVARAHARRSGGKLDEKPNFDEKPNL